MTDADEIPLHHRGYDVTVARRGDREIVVRGRVTDTKPAGLYVSDDPDELVLHDMTVELLIAVPDMTITSATAHFGSHPHRSCPAIVDAYRALEGVGVTRGFGATVRRLFGGPSGCTHITALLGAMAPAVVQAMWSIRVHSRQPGDRPAGATAPGEASPDQLFASSLNTCHVWAEDGEHVAALRRGESAPIPLQVSRRLGELGRDPGRWPEGGR